jgi:membrane fusion protein (multidrug efflux system)
VQLDPVRVVFSVTDRALVSLRQQEAAGQTITPQQFKLSLVLANGSTYPQRGTIQFIDNEVSTQTGTVAVRALFANPDQILVPGQVVAVQLLDEAIGELPVVPMASVMQDRQGKYVFVLGQDNRVSRRPIVTGARIGNRWAVTSGVKEGEQIITQGLQRIADQQLVSPREANDNEGAEQ